ncbi:MAG: M56 family metallopeptidase [Oscillospiraceae bacterium]|nr:M56 family metallopeptidase [Oscillospiraceae bacterium]
MNTIGILELNLSGGLLILAVILLRALALDRLPKGTFLALWLVAAVRLLVPVSIPSPLSVYSLVRRAPEMPAAMAPAAGPAVAVLPVLTGTETEAVPGAPAVPLWEMVWLAGALVCGGFFLLSYLRCRREYRTALPVGEELRERCRDRLGRRIALRQSDRVAAPLTYGLLHPVILLPRDFDPSDGERLDYVLEHELVHIRRLDGLTKLVLAAAACVHWFNPLAWAMLVLANRDIELRCDEAVVARFGRDKRSAYAMTLIAMEAQKSGLGPFASAFSKNAIEERIRAIMKMKKRSLAAIMAAVVLVCCVSVAFAT